MIRLNTNPQLEKLFLAYITENPEYFDSVQPEFFNESAIALVYEQIKNNYFKYKRYPSVKQVYTTITNNQQLTEEDEDNEDELSISMVETIMEATTSGIDLEWLGENFEAWLTVSRLGEFVHQTIQGTRGLKPNSLEQVMTFIEQTKKELAQVVVDNPLLDLGLDFDNPEHHVQDSVTGRVATGFNTLNELLNGGWEPGTLNVIMGETNIGKSMFIHNMAVNAANAGFNVGFVSLEMSERKIMKRLGGIRLSIPIKQYDKLSQDPDYIKERLEAIKASRIGKKMPGLTDFNLKNPWGKIYIKRMITSGSSCSKIQNWIDRIQDHHNMKLDIVFIDYINLMALERGTSANNSYEKVKYLAEGMRDLAIINNIPFVTVTQITRDKFGQPDVTKSDVPESKNLIDTADTFFGIIRTDEMRRNKLYRLKQLKLRDSEQSYDFIELDFNVEFMRLENDRIWEIPV